MTSVQKTTIILARKAVGCFLIEDQPLPKFSEDVRRPTESEFLTLANPADVYNESLRLTESAENEILAAIVPEKSILRNAENLQFFSRKIERENSGATTGKKFRIRLLVPVTDLSSLDTLEQLLKGMEYRTIESAPLSLAVYDRKKALVVHYKTDPVDSHQEVFVSAVLTTNPEIVASLVSVFDYLWTANCCRKSIRQGG